MGRMRMRMRRREMGRMCREEWFGGSVCDGVGVHVRGM